jgi:hypothetical protein
LGSEENGPWCDTEKGRQLTLAYHFEELWIKVRALGQVNNLEICINLELSTTHNYTSYVGLSRIDIERAGKNKQSEVRGRSPDGIGEGVQNGLPVDENG